MTQLSYRIPALALALVLFPQVAHARDLDADPSTLAARLGELLPGDTLHLSRGTYGHFTLRDLVGTAAMPIILSGPADRSAVISADDGPCCNTIQIDGNVSYVELRHLTVDGHGVDGAFGIDARGDGVHHITIEDCTFVGHDASQQTVAISTKTATSGWVIRGNRILGAGTGMYLGNSDGTDPFVEGLIENNLFFDTLGYNVQIKWQLPHDAVPGSSGVPASTVLRHNVFIKTDRPSPDGDRPNLLVGGFPASGPNAEDRYEIYGNVFVHNPRESLFQGSGRVSLHDNLFFDTPNTAILVQDHDLPLRRAWIYDNTIHVSGTGVSVGSAAPEGVVVAGNAIFAGTPIRGSGEMRDNVVAAFADAAMFVNAPTGALGTADYHPRVGALTGAALDLSVFAADRDHAVDFNCRPRGANTSRGAYATEGSNPGWRLAMENPPALCGAMGMSDAGVNLDGGVASGADASGVDGGGLPPAPSGCSCRASRGDGSLWGVAMLALLGLTLGRRAARGRRITRG